ncbi:MAG: cytidylate kinase family protein [Bacteroidetes bacterium]|uniref:Cytidylate kinase family protein n=1 Tax=Candidatus Pullibacteroides excrementavium TaxID=2840905 RepID=A0A9D9DW49_9BACT|nr:cytidylate kinase family protein [Candidatus Pullibacteroides excrementavium]
MNTRNPRAYILFVIALAINAFGIAFITRALLGTSPITSITYVMSMFTSLTMGQWTIVLNLGFMILELPFMRKEDLRTDLACYLLQIPTTLFFGSFIDVSMNALSWLQPEMYVLKIASLLFGCVILALGIALEVKANVAMAAGEYFVKAIARRLRTDFGYTKLGFDSSLVALSCIVSYAVMGTIQGVREGTVVAAVIVGPIVHFISPWFKVFDRFLYPSGKTGRPAGQASLPVEDFHPGHRVITIAREFGSGGHLLGEMLSKELGIRLYDKEFIHLSAQESGMDEAYIRKNEQSIPSFWLKSVYAQNKNTVEQSMAPDDVLFVAESKIVQEAAAKEDCVIVGRCADFVLDGQPGLIRVFCCAGLDDARQRCVQEYGLPADKAESEIKRVNRKRMAHYEYYTGRKWGDPHHYDLVVNTSHVSIEEACRMIGELYRHALQNK